MKHRIKVLLIEYSPLSLSGIIGEFLSMETNIHFILESVNNIEDGLKIIKQGDIELIFLNITENFGLDMFTNIYHLSSEIPIIILSDINDKNTAIKALGFGAQDYLTIQELSFRMISRSVRYALERNKIRLQLKEALDKLNEAMDNIKALRGLLPICAKCKRIRDDEGYWQQIEKYITERSDAEFTHSICPACVRELYPDMADSVLQKKNDV